MIARIWKAWAVGENVEAYQTVFREKIVPAVTAGIEGYRGANLLKRQDGDRVELTTVFWFESMRSIEAFAGREVSRAVVPESARRLLSEYRDTVEHHEVVV